MDELDSACPDHFSSYLARYELEGNAEDYCLAVLTGGEQIAFKAFSRDKPEYKDNVLDKSKPLPDTYWEIPTEGYTRGIVKMPPMFWEMLMIIERRWACFLFNEVMDDYTHMDDCNYSAALDDDYIPVIMNAGGDYECHFCETCEPSVGETNNCINLSPHCQECAIMKLNPAATKIQALVRGNNQRWICPLYLFNKLS
tara:strand:- start:4 stop:597 length:594 start_codon:yes stop_codon:yes gene_type:complete